MFSTISNLGELNVHWKLFSSQWFSPPQRWVYVTFLIVPQIGFQTHLTAKRGVSWEISSPLCWFTNLSLGHFPSCSLHRFSNTLLVIQDVCWKMVLHLCCFLVFRLWHFPYTSPHKFSITFNLVKEEVILKFKPPQCFFTYLGIWPLFKYFPT